MYIRIHEIGFLKANLHNKLVALLYSMYVLYCMYKAILYLTTQCYVSSYTSCSSTVQHIMCVHMYVSSIYGRTYVQYMLWNLCNLTPCELQTRCQWRAEV